jgi:hypothetical protein
MALSDQPSRISPSPPRTLFVTRLEGLTARFGLIVFLGAPLIVALLVAPMFKRIWWPMILVAGAAAAGPVLVIAGQSASRRALKRHAYRLCPGCRYPLDGLGPDGACPECGRPFNAQAVERLWAEQYGRPHPMEMPSGSGDP